MDSRARHLTILFSLIAVLIAALPALAQASPDGDDDPTYNAGSAFGTQYSSLDTDRNGYLSGARPVTDQAPDGSSVTANVMYQYEGCGETPERAACGQTQFLRLTRFDANGQPTGFTAGTGISESDLAEGDEIDELLDIRVLDDGTFWVLARGSRGNSGEGSYLLRYHFSAAGELLGTVGSKLPVPCQPEIVGRIGSGEYDGFVDAARVKPDGGVTALWDCIPVEESPDTRLDDGEDHAVFVTTYALDNAVESAARELPDAVSYGEDLEFGPNGDPYALVGTYPQDPEMRFGENGTSTVFHVNADATLSLAAPVAGSVAIDGLPVDLAVDSQARPVVWTQPEELKTRADDGNYHWDIWRLTAGLTALDASWGDAGHTVISDPRLDAAYGGSSYYSRKVDFLTVRPGDKVLATGGYRPESGGSRGLNDYSNGMIAGLTAAGQTDTGFATNGFKEFSFDAPNSFRRIGEPTLQSDGKVLVPHTTNSTLDRAAQSRIAPPPGENEFVGVTRLVGATPSSTTGGFVPPVRPITVSGVPTICGRRAISLVRADVKGRKVKLTGLVGAALYGKKVTIQTDPKGARNSKFTKTGTVTASRTDGSFTATVPRPKASDFVSIRYRAVSGSAKSPSLKLPQRLTSRSVKSAKNTITVKGKVKKSVLGKRNKVLIRRLVCGRYRTVGSARPDKNGNYTVTFASTQIRGVAFYRAESMVLRKAGSKKYVIQYARAIAIRTTSQTG